MADYTIRTVHTKRTEYVLPSPTNWAELGKVIEALSGELGEDRGRWDDAVTVEARDAEIVDAASAVERGGQPDGD